MAQGEFASNKSLQVTFDSPRTFAAAKARVDSNAPEFRRYVKSSHNHGQAKKPIYKR